MKKRIALIRCFLSCNSADNSGPDDSGKETQSAAPDNWIDLMIMLTGEAPLVCKECGEGHMVLVEVTEMYRVRDR